MIISGKHVVDGPLDTYLAASWDRRRAGYFRREWHPRYQRRIWNKRVDGYAPCEHAVRIWTKFAGRVRITRAA